MNKIINGIKNFKLYLIITFLSIIISLISYEFNNFYLFLLFLVIALTSYFMSILQFFSDIIIFINNIKMKINEILNIIKQKILYGNVEINHTRKDMYKVASKFTEKSTEKLLIIQKTPTIFFPIREVEGKDYEEDFYKKLTNKIFNSNVKIIILFNMFDQKFINEFCQYDQDIRNKILNNIKKYCNLRNQHNFKNRLKIASLPPNSYSVYPLIISDNDAVFWLTGVHNQRIFIEIDNLDKIDELYKYYDEYAEIEMWNCDRYINKFIESVKC